MTLHMRLATAAAAAFLLLSIGSARTASAAPPEPLPLDTAACGKKPDYNCVVELKNVRALQLMSEREALLIAAEAEELSSIRRNNHHTYATLGGQRVASWVLLVMVLIIVGTGLRMSWLHMMNDFAKGQKSDNTIEAGKDGAKMTSSVIGLVIFFISTFFFWVYVDRVYEVTFIKSARADGAPTNKAAHTTAPGSSAAPAAP
jgi:hypothetical protein